MAQRPAPPRYRGKLRSARDDRARDGCSCGSCLAVSPCPEGALEGSGGRRVRVLDASLRRRMTAGSLGNRPRGRPAAVAAARVRRTWRPRALPAAHALSSDRAASETLERGAGDRFRRRRSTLDPARARRPTRQRRFPPSRRSLGWYSGRSELYGARHVRASSPTTLAPGAGETCAPARLRVTRQPIRTAALALSCPETGPSRAPL
jgi:hypothetical protein